VLRSVRLAASLLDVFTPPKTECCASVRLAASLPAECQLA